MRRRSSCGARPSSSVRPIAGRGPHPGAGLPHRAPGRPRAVRCRPGPGGSGRSARHVRRSGPSACRLRFTADQRVRPPGARRRFPADRRHLRRPVSLCISDHAGCAHTFPSAQMVLGDGELAHARSGADKYSRSVDVARVVAGTVVAARRGRTICSATARWLRCARPAIRRGMSEPARAAAGPRICPHRGCAPRSRDARLSETPFPGDHDPAEAIRSIRRIKSVADECGADIWINHDPTDWDRLRPRHLRFESPPCPARATLVTGRSVDG